jgi:hypothetical protein
MSKDNTVIIVPCVNGNFYVRNVQAAEYLTYEPDVVPVGEIKPYYNINAIYDYFIRDFPSHAENFMKQPFVYACLTVIAKNKDDAIKIATIMCSNEEKDTGWGPEYGMSIESRVIPFDIESLRKLFRS